MKQQQKQQKYGTRKHLVVFTLIGLTLSLLLLSACGSLNNATTGTKANTSAIIAVPTVDAALKSQGDSQLQTLQQWIALLQQYGGNVSSYQQQYDTDQQALRGATTNTTYKTALATLKNQVAAIQLPTMKAQSQKLAQQLNQQVQDWGNTHKHFNAYDNTNYALGYEYGSNGIGGWVQDELNAAKNIADYQQAIEDINMYLTNFQMMTANTADKQPYNQIHQTDLDLMKHYGKTGKVIVVSLQEQAMRVYDNGKLVNAFLATTGRPDRPSIPGVWWVEGKQSPTVFKAGVPKSSPYWFPDTPINYAIQYHSQGYFIHDSWWRATYGPGTNFPHADASGDAFSSQGSHGCVNLSKENATWLYSFVKLYTSIIIY